MQCNFCNTELPPGAEYCPRCGTVTPYRSQVSGTLPHDPTAVSYPSDYVPYKPPTDYGSPPFGTQEQTPYASFNPYDVPLQAPPPPKPQRHIKLGIIVGTVVLILILINVGVLFWVVKQVKNNVTNTPPPSHTPIVQANATAISTTGNTPTTIPSPVVGPRPTLTTDCGHLVTPWVALYQYAHFGGRELCFEGKGLINLADFGFDKQTQSINIAAYGAFYDQPDGQGAKLTFYYADEQADLGNWDNQISSFIVTG